MIRGRSAERPRESRFAEALGHASLHLRRGHRVPRTVRGVVDRFSGEVLRRYDRQRPAPPHLERSPSHNANPVNFEARFFPKQLKKIF